MLRRALVLLAALSLACGGPSSVRSTSTTPRVTTASGARRVLVLTDLEEVRDVAVSADGTTHVATDSGVLVYGADPETLPSRIGRAEGLPSDDVTALALEADGSLLVATSAGLVSLRGSEVMAIEGVPAHARPLDLAVQPDGTAFLCTLSGLLRRSEGAWARFGEPLECTTLAPTPEGHLWVGTTSGVHYVEGTSVRHHGPASGIPEPYVRSIVPVLPGQILALVQGPQRAQLALWDGTQWSGYTLPGLAEPVVGLALRDGESPTLFTRDRAFAIAPSGSGTALRPIGAHAGSPRSYEAAISTEETAVPEVDLSRALRPAQPLAEPREGGPGVRAPELVAVPLASELPPGMYRTIQTPERAFVAVGNAGVLEISRRAAPRALRSRSLVPEEDLQTATESRGGNWVRARGGQVAKWIDGRLRRLVLPDEISPQSIATGPRGAYLAALTPASPRTLRVFVSESGSWRPLLERELDVAPTAVSALAVDPRGRIWAAIRVARESGEGTRPRGVVVIDPSSEEVLAHHRGAAQGSGLPIPDEVSAITFDANGDAWLATLNGAVRVDAHQAIVFDETRGVRGEVVTDVASGSGVMWIAAAEGLGSYAERSFDFHQPAIVREHRPTALATDAAGHLWGAGPNGLLQHDGTTWHHLGATEGLPVEALSDVEIDGDGRVWLLTRDAVVVLTSE